MSICKNCGIVGPAQTSKCYPSEVGNEMRHEFLIQAQPAPGNFFKSFEFIEPFPSHFSYLYFIFAFDEFNLMNLFYLGLERIEARLEALEERNSIAQDERISFFNKAMPKSSGKHSIASATLDAFYGHRCLFCDETNDVTKAHIVAGNNDVNYSVFCKPHYRDDLDVKSPRNFIPLCGTDGKAGTCHNEFDKYLMTLLYNPLLGTFEVRCLRDSFPKYEFCHGRVVNVDSNNPPYRRLLAWRTRKCILEHQPRIRGEVHEWLLLCNFSENSHSIANAAEAETENDSKESDI
jgi:hypothetical protein